jgi:iron complex transport system ATP-binding protein
MIEIHGLSLRLGKRQVLRGIDLRAEAGQLTAIVGPNGSGKTTLLRAISGDLRYEGSIRVNGREVSATSAADLAADRGVLQQSASLSFPFTVHEVVRLGLRGKDENDPVGRALERVDLSRYGGRKYQELSGGEQQRVQLARVLCQVSEPIAGGAPRWLFLDEPVSSLDIHHQIAVMRLAREFAARGGGVVAVMHDLNLTAMFADAVVVMMESRAIATGSPAEVFTDEILSRAYGCPIRVGATPAGGVPFVLPHV